MIQNLSNTSFSGYNNIKILLLSNNTLKTIEAGTFNDLGILYYLDLGENDLTTIHGDIWVGLYSLETIRISHNPLNTKSSVGFPNLPDLRLVLVDLVILKALNKELSAPANYPDTKTQPKLGLEEDDLPCDNNMCWLKKLEDKGLMALTRPRCRNKTLYWDEYLETLNCPGRSASKSSGKSV